MQTDTQERLKENALNIVAYKKKKHPFLRFISLFVSPLPLLLLGLSALAMFTGEIHGTQLIALMVFLSTVLAYVQE